MNNKVSRNSIDKVNRKRNQKKKKNLSLIIVLFILLLSTLVVYNIKRDKLDVSVTTGSNLTIDSPVVIDVETRYKNQLFTSDSISMNIAHKYNSNETITINLEPYSVGKYEIVITPNYTGEYLWTLTLNNPEGESQVKQGSFIIN